MSYIYLASDWNNPDKSLSSVLEENNIPMYDWEKYFNITLQENADMSIGSIKDAKMFVAVLTNPEHPYQGTMEHLMIALTLNKPVYVYVGLPEKETYKYNRRHNWDAKFDRYPIYHSRVNLFKEGEWDTFVETVLKRWKST